MIGEEFIEILYNTSYGGWGISDKAIELYKLRNVNDNSMALEYECHELLSRTDPILIQIYNELGDEMNTKCCKIRIKKIPKKYENYYYISEYDGKESIAIDFTNYKLDMVYNKITEILQSTNNNEIKIIKIEEFMSTLKCKDV
uniref:Uncharacterized protein n=1 Tax=viral metagenome TaxID=1070528 RepID=A0A6C0IEK8_9ZZZZ